MSGNCNSLVCGLPPSNTPLSKGPGIEVYAGGDCYMLGCEHAFHPENNCRGSICIDCDKQMREENLPESIRRRIRQYKFPGCKNHSFWDMEPYTDKAGAHWCTKAHQKAHPKDPRPKGCVHCKRPYVFCGNKQQRRM